MAWQTPNPYSSLTQDDFDMDVDVPFEGKGAPGLHQDPTPGPVVTIQPNNKPVERLTTQDLKWVQQLYQAEEQAAEAALLGTLQLYKPPPEREFVQVKRKGRQGKHNYHHPPTRVK